MAFLRKKIWLAFYFTVFLWTICLIIASCITQQTVYKEFSQAQRSLTLLKATSLNSSFNQYETILNIVARELVRENSYENDTLSSEILSYAVELDPSITAFVIYNNQGERMSSAPYFETPEGFSLLQLEQSQSTFKQALNSNQIVLGRTYFSELVKTIILPIRKAIRNENGEVLFVLALSINMEQGFDYFLNDYQPNSSRTIYLFRESDRYFQLAPMEMIMDKEVYLRPVSEQIVQQSIKQLLAGTDMSFDAIKQSGDVFIFNKPSSTSLAASIYLPKYQLWLTSEIKLSVIDDNLYTKLKPIIIGYLLSLMAIFVLFRNIARNQNRENEVLLYQVNHDYLTNLYNRYYADQYLKNMDSDISLAIIFIDIDNFKVVNENFGDGVGDKVLVEIASRLKSFNHYYDLLVRSGPNEFMFLYPAEHRKIIHGFCNKIMTTIQSPIITAQYNITLTASMGVSIYPRDGSTLKLVKRNANLAMSESKKEKNNITFFDQNLLEQYLYKNDVEIELKKALQLGELYLTYQPQYNHLGQLQGVEALVRWHNEKLGIISPDKFIPVAESMGYMEKLGDFITITAMSEIKALQMEIGQVFDLSINVSVKQFQSIDYFDRLMKQIQTIEFNSHRLLLEVTESVLIDDIEDMRSLMYKLKENHIRISLDDFGTGYSSLNVLKNLPIDELKIDRSFVSDMLSEANDYSMVEGIMRIAKKRNMMVVAEGIETEGINQSLKQLGCDLYQGYYYSKPLILDDLKALLLCNVHFDE